MGEGHNHVVATSVPPNASQLYWSDKLAGSSLDSFPDLTGNRPGAKSAQHEREIASSQISLNDLEKAVALIGTTPLAVAQTAWSLLLYTYSESETPCVVFGTASKPTEGGAAALIPTILDISPSVQDPSAELTIADILERFARDNVIAQYHTFSRGSQEELRSDTALGVRCHDNEGLEEIEKGLVVIEIVTNSSAGAITLVATYSTTVLSSPAAICMLEQLDDVLAHILAHPEAPFLSSYTAIRPSLQSSRNPNPPKLSTPVGGLLHSWFEHHARTSPDALALWYKSSLDSADAANTDVRWSYRDLNERANRLARVLRSILGDIKDEPILMYLEKTPGLYLSMLAIIKAGGAWCPLDPAAPVLRNRDMLARAGGRLVIYSTEAEKQAAVEASIVPESVIAFSLEDPRVFAEKDGSDLGIEVAPEHLAYLIWTSGTTGMPKGVPVEHRAIVQTVASLEQVLPWKESTGVRHMQFAAATFDVSIIDIFYSWAKPCGTVTSATRELLIGRFPDLANAFKATHVNLTPSFMATFRLSDCPTLQVVGSAGEKLPDVVADFWSVDGVESVNCYGPAECAVVTIGRNWEAGEAKKAGNVGHPFPTASCFVIKGDTVLPRGAAGELALGGHQLARGYLGQPDKTAAKFVHHPVAGRVYLTGDVVRFLHDGTCEFVGRTDDLIKLGGIRIELSEISAALNRSHPLAREAATLQLRRPDRPMDVICTFVAVPSLPASPVVEPSPLAVELALAAQDMAERSLPSYMLPHMYIPLNRIPITASNKIDRKTLSAIYANLDLKAWEKALGAARGFVFDEVDEAEESKWNEVETKLRTAIIELTDASPDAVRKGTQLKALGVDSIRAILLSSRFRSYGLNLTVADILRSNSIRDLHKTLESCSGPVQTPKEAPDSGICQQMEAFNQAWLPIVSKEAKGIKKIMPCTPLQEGVLGEMAQDPRTYWTHHLLTLGPDVDVEKLREAWKMVAEANDVLRIGFIAAAAVEGAGDIEKEHSATFIQLLYSDVEVNWQMIHTGNALEAAIEERAAGFIASRIGHNLPPWALTLFSLGDDRRVLTLSIHHSIHDGDTLNLLFSDVQAAYFGGRAPRRLQFSEALILTQPTDLDECASFWSNALTEFADPDAPAFPNLAGRARSFTGTVSSFISHCIPTAVSTAALTSVARDLGCPLGNVIQAAWAVVLCAYLETSSVVFGETMSDRLTTSRLASALGPLVTVTPVPCKISDGKTCRALVGELKTLYESSLPYRHVQLSKIKKALKRPNDQPVFATMFVVHVEGDDEDAPSGARLWDRAKDVVGVAVEHALALNVEVRKEGKIELDLWGNHNFVGPAQLELLLAEVDAILSAIVADPDQPLLSITSAATFPEQLLSIAKPSPSDNLRAASLQPPTWWLEHHAMHNPDYVAAIVASAIEETGAPTRQWTYRELNEASNRVANLILSIGLRDKVVAFCVGRTLEAYAYQLGIFKSGNTYLPVEEDLPTSRKVLLVKDSAAALIFTTREMAPEFADCLPSVSIISVDALDHKASLLKQPSTSPDVTYNPEAASYLLYTSGSTGTPKGVLVSFRNLTSFIEAFVELIDRECPIKSFAGKGRYLGRTSIAFDVHLLELFGAFRMGIAAASAPRSLILDDLRLTLQTLRISHASLVPSLLERAELLPSEVPSLRWLSVGGEKISARIVDVWGDGPGGVVLFNAYGPTELTIGCSIARVTKQSSPRSIGKIFENSTAYVLKPDTLEPALRGEPGELCVTGDLVAIGYLNRPDVKGFLDKFRGQRVYRTGDMVRLMADDSIDYLGRTDDQAKIRGQRLELAEVSEFLRSNAKGRFAFATLIVRHPDIQRDWLVSFVGNSAISVRSSAGVNPIIEATSSETITTLHNACRKHLPAFMVPDIILMLDFIPLAAVSGKADAKLLRRLITETPVKALLGEGGKEQSKPPRSFNYDEERVRDVLAHFIKGEEAWHPHTTTFELGFDSLSAISLSFKLKSAGIKAQVPFLLGGPSIEQIALCSKVVSRGSSVLKSAAKTYLRDFEARIKAQIEGIYPRDAITAVRPTLPLQEGLIARSLDSLTPAYLNHLVFHLEGNAHHHIMEAFDATIASHDILRTCFTRVGDHIVQVVLSPLHSPSPWHNRALPPASDDLEIIRSSFVEVATNIVQSLERAPPIRLSLWSSKCKSYLAVSIHHALYDGESLPNLLKEVEDRCLGNLVPERVPFSAMVEYLASQKAKEARTFFEQYLGDLRQAAQLEPIPDGLEPFTYEIKIVSRLTEVESNARSANISLHTYAQAAYAIAIAEHFKHDDVVFGVVLSGRTVPIQGADTIMGPCVTTVPVRVRLRDGMTMREIAQQVQRDSPSLLTHQHTPIRSIQRWAGIEQPLFDVLFSFTRAEPLGLSSKLWEQCAELTSVDYHLALEVEAHESTNEIVVRATYTSTFGRDASGAIVERVQKLLSDMKISVTLSSSAATLTVAPPQIEEYADDTWSSDEETVRAAVAEVCNVEATVITKNISFLRLGLDSISSIRLSQRLRRVGLNLRSSTIMANASVGSLASYLSSRGGPIVQDDPLGRFATFSEDLYRVHAKSTPLLSPEDRIDAVYSATPLQTAMLTSTLASRGRAYVIPHPLRLNPSVNVERLRLSWQDVVSRLEIFRTTFHPGVDLPWIAAVHRDAPIRWVEHDEDSEGVLSKEVSRILEASTVSSMEEFEVPPVVVHIIYTSGSPVFMPVIHHSLYDGLSLQYILRDVERVYHGRGVFLRPQFSAALPYVLHRPKGDIEFWRNRLRGYQPTSIKSVYKDQDAKTHSSERRASISGAVIEEACRTLEVTVQAAVILSWGKVLATLTGQNDVAFGHVVSGRSIPLDNAFEVAGPLFNTIPFRFKVPEDASSNADAARMMHLAIVAAEPYQHTPLRELQAACQTRGAFSGLFDTLFVFQNMGRETTEGVEPLLWHPEPLQSETDEPEYLLNIEVEYSGEHLTLRATCRSGVMDEKKLAGVLDSLDEVLTDVIKKPESSATAFPGALRSLRPSPTYTAVAHPRTEKVPESRTQESFSAEEQQLRKVLAEVARVPIEKIGRRTPLYAIGLDSIAAIQVASRSRRKGISASVADILTGGHIEGICARVAARPRLSESKNVALVTQQERMQALSILNMTEGQVETILPVLAGQQNHLASWIACGRTFFEAPFVYHLPKSVDGARLANAWRSLRQRHSILRTTFASLSAEKVVQVIIKDVAGEDTTYGLVEIEGNFKEGVFKLLRHEGNTPSDMFTPPVRARHIRGQGQDAFVLILHHSLYDGWSIPLLVADLTALYEGQPCESSAAFTELVQHIRGTADVTAHRNFWAAALTDAEPTILRSAVPTNLPTPPSPTLPAFRPGATKARVSVPVLLRTAASRIQGWLTGRTSPTSAASANGAAPPVSTAPPTLPSTLVIPSALRDVPALTAAAAAAHVTAPALLLAAVARVVARLTDTASPVLGHTRTARSASVENVERLAGPTLNELPLRVPGARDGALADVARAAQAALGAMTAHEQVGWREAVAWAGRKDEILCNVYVNVLWHAERVFEQPSALLERWDVGVATDFAPSHPIPGKTAVDSLDHSHIHETRLFLSLWYNPATGHVDLALRNGGPILDEAGLQDFVKQFTEAVEAGVRELEHA